MISLPFNAQQGLIIAWAEIFGPSGSILLRLALDTGATASMINLGPLVAVGYDPSLVSGRVQVTTGSSVEFVPRTDLSRFRALGQERMLFPVLAYTLPPSATIDGLLGLDSLRGCRLEIDFRQGRLSLT